MAFEKGRSGNPAGRPVGVGRVHELRRLLQTKAVDVIESVLRKAIDGDSVAQKMILDRLLPTLRPVDLPVTIPRADGDIAAQANLIIDQALSSGISADVAARLMQSLLAYQQMTVLVDLERRILALEEKGNGND